MRRGDLDQYPLDGVMVEAGRDRVTGAIELHTRKPAVLLVHDGRIYLALRDGEMPPEVDEDLDDRQYQAALVAEEIRQRGRVIDVLREQIEQLDEDAEGYYFHQPLTDHPLAGAWGWDPAELYEEARAAIGADDVSEATPGEASDEVSGGASERARAVDGSDDLPFEPVAPDATARLGSNPPEGPVARDAWNLLRDLVGTRSLDDLLAARGEVDGLEGAAWLRDCGLIDIVETTGDDGDPVDPTDEGDDGDGDDDEPSRRGERRRRWGR